MMRDRIVERQNAALNLSHHHRRRGENFGEGGEIENSIVASGSRFRVERQSAEGFAPQRLP